MAKHTIPEVITEEEFIKLLRTVKQPHHKISFILGFYAAMRVSEVVNLQQENIDRGQRIIRIKQAKGSKDRNIPLPPQAIRGLTQIPIKCGIRALQISFKNYADKTLHKNLHFHQLRHCHTDDVEILTEEGWKKRKQLKKDELIYTLNLERNLIEKSPIKNIHSYSFNGYLNHLENRHVTYTFTDEHKLLVQRRAPPKTKPCWGDWELISWSKLPTQFNLKTAGFKKEGQKIGLGKASLLGWILSDGTIRERKQRDGSPSGKHEILISQSLSANPKKVEIIKKAFQISKIKFSMSNSTSTSKFTGKQSEIITFRPKQKDIKWVFDYVNYNRTPKWNLLSLCGEELKEIHNSMMLGDGSRDTEYSNQNKDRIDFFRVLSHLINKRAVLGEGVLNNGKRKGQHKFRTYVSNRDHCQIKKIHIMRKRYKGIVWCPETNNGTFIVKSKGKIFMSGNSGATHYLNKKKWSTRQVQQLLGHSKIQTTEIYTHVTPEVLINKMWEEKE